MPIPLRGNHISRKAARHPDTGYDRPGQGYPPPPPKFMSSPTGHGKPGLIAAGVVGLVVVLAAGVVIGVIIAGGGSERRPAAVAASSSAPARPSTLATTTPLQEAAPGLYSMNGIANACDLVDPTPLHRWSSTPDQAPYHHETPPSNHDPGSLSCQFSYKSQSGDGVHWNQAAIDLRVEFTAAGAAPAYDEWKQEDTTGPGANSGEVAGIGSRGYWHTATSDSSNSTGLDYVVGVEDDNVWLRVRIPILRQHGEPPLNPDELRVIAGNQARQALDGLRRK
ncbi:hypothetical protein [Nocardia australiensis]|uniref:hypothetical protein n=1 Tax=Nocardia australiensis TaxID=2887191 RepID=UPI001D14735F|nr:hypothetical protein [Nocardia australiensis]